MLGRLASFRPRVRASKTTLVFRAPVRAIRIVQRRQTATHIPVAERLAVGLGAAILMLPLGVWLGRRTAD
ncbi:MAG TPA: hypothetical protein VIL18_02935 [Longimicrobiales bacterium]